VSYDPAVYWSRVAEHVDARPEGEGWDLAGNSGAFDRYKRDLTLSRLRDLPVAGRAVLELGCGPGGNLRALSERQPKRLVGADVAERMLMLARRHTEESGIELVHLTGEILPFGDREFDTSLTVTVLQHNPSDVAARLVKELARVTGSTLELIEDTTVWRPRSHAGSYFVRATEEYVKWATAEGFRLVDVTHINVWVSERAWLLIRRIGGLKDRQPFGEGAPLRSFEQRLQALALRLTRRLDGRTPPLSGLTAVRFQRLG
jgi:SAM-dependent methyltransferase